MFGGMNLKGGADSFLSRIRNNMSWGTMAIIIAVIAFLIVSIYYYNKVIAPKMNPSYKANSENIPIGSQGGKQAELLMFSVDWCPHCKTAKPEWESVKQEYQGKTINGISVYKIIIEPFLELKLKNISKYLFKCFPIGGILPGILAWKNCKKVTMEEALNHSNKDSITKEALEFLRCQN